MNREFVDKTKEGYSVHKLVILDLVCKVISIKDLLIDELKILNKLLDFEIMWHSAEWVFFAKAQDFDCSVTMSTLYFRLHCNFCWSQDSKSPSATISLAKSCNSVIL